jgi:hypothetical protein
MAAAPAQIRRGQATTTAKGPAVAILGPRGAPADSSGDCDARGEGEGGWRRLGFTTRVAKGGDAGAFRWAFRVSDFEGVISFSSHDGASSAVAAAEPQRHPPATAASPAVAVAAALVKAKKRRRRPWLLQRRQRPR